VKIQIWQFNLEDAALKSKLENPIFEDPILKNQC